MTKGDHVHRALVAIAAAAPFALASCATTAGPPDVTGSEPTSPHVSQSTVAVPDVVAQAKEAFEGKVPDDATLECPDPLPAEEKATTRCTWTIPGKGTLGMTVTVTTVEDGAARLHFANDAKTTSPS